MKVTAQITLAANAGNVLKRGFSGMRPAFVINGYGSVCEITWPEVDQWLELGETRDVIIDLALGSDIHSDLSSGVTFELRVGATIMGKGIILAAIDANP